MRKVFLRSLLVFFGAYILLYIFTMLPGIKPPIASAYKSMANTFVVPSFSNAYLLFEQNPGMTSDPYGLRVRLESQARVDEQMQAARQQGLKTIDLKFQTYNIFLFEFFIFPLLFFVALLLATPVAWRRKLQPLLIGTVLILVFMFFKTYFITLYHLQRNQVEAYQMSEFWEGVIGKVQLGFNNITTALITATLIWALTVFRKGDWKKLTEQWKKALAQQKTPAGSK